MRHTIENEMLLLLKIIMCLKHGRTAQVLFSWPRIMAASLPLL